MRPSTRIRVASLRAAVALVATVAFAVSGISSASAQAEGEAPAVRWSVAPAGVDGPDGRRSIEHEVDPGEVIEEHLAVRNISDTEVEFRLDAADGFFTSTGRFDMLTADKESIDSGTWISVPETVTVGAGETAVVPFEIVVPDRAEPGDHAAGITASILSVNSAEDGTAVGVESRIGFRVLTRVTGEITPAATLANLGGGYTTSWNPLRPGELTVTFDVTNDGNTRLLAEGSVSAGGRTVFFPGPEEPSQELLPGDTREMSVTLTDVWPLFAVPATVTLDPAVITMDENASIEIAPVQADTVVWAMPWPQLIVLLGVLLVVFAILGGRIRSRRRLNALLEGVREEAREAGRAEARRERAAQNEATEVSR